MMIRSIFLTTVVGTISLLLGAQQTVADDNLSQNHVREMVEKGEILPLSKIRKINAEHLEGRLLDVELERDQGVLVYEFELLTSDGLVLEYYIDAVNGELLNVEEED